MSQRIEATDKQRPLHTPPVQNAPPANSTTAPVDYANSFEPRLAALKKQLPGLGPDIEAMQQMLPGLLIQVQKWVNPQTNPAEKGELRAELDAKFNKLEAFSQMLEQRATCKAQLADLFKNGKLALEADPVTRIAELPPELARKIRDVNDTLTAIKTLESQAHNTPLQELLVQMQFLSQKLQVDQRSYGTELKATLKDVAAAGIKKLNALFAQIEKAEGITSAKIEQLKTEILSNPASRFIKQWASSIDEQIKLKGEERQQERLAEEKDIKRTKS